MPLKIRKRYLLVLAIAAVQSFCLAWGVVVFDAWLRGALRDTVHHQVLVDNVQTANQMASLIRELDVKDPREDQPSWDRLQSVVREIKLPNDGYVCIVDQEDGAVLCHPALLERPDFAAGGMKKGAMAKAPMAQPSEAAAGVATADMAKAGMNKAPMKGAQMMGAWSPTVHVPRTCVMSGGNLGMGDIVQTEHGLEIVAAAPIPEFGAQVLVHQLGRGVDAAVSRNLEPVRPIGMAVSFGLVALTTLGVIGVIRRYEDRLADINEHLEELVVQRTRALTKTRDAVIFGLAKLAESRDTDTGEHLERIRTYTTLLAERLRDDGLALDDGFVGTVGLASSLHDIGKVGVPDAVLLKPGRLDPDERAVIETHAKTGGDCLAAIGDRLGEDDFLQLAKEIAYAHHERWDGAGYPFGLSGESIPLAARIVAVADVYDALRSQRPYKKAMTHDEARSILLEGAGAHFDPVVIEAFLACEEAFQRVAPTEHEAFRDEAALVTA